MAAEEAFRTDEASVGAELARYYDLDMDAQAADVDLYLALARAVDGPILEMAAGSGRICVPLAAAGHEVVGVDIDGAMLDRARAAHEKMGGEGSLELVQADITSLSMDRRFSLVVLAFNSLLMLSGRDAQKAALSVMAAHLAPGGRAVIDVVLPTPEDLGLYDTRVELAWQRIDQETGDRVAKLWSARYDSAAAIARIETMFDTWPDQGGPVRRVSRTDEMHLLSASDLLDMAERAGLRPETVAGDHEMGPFGPDSLRVVLVSGLL